LTETLRLCFSAPLRFSFTVRGIVPERLNTTKVNQRHVAKEG
jgi:hypothetical protein